MKSTADTGFEMEQGESLLGDQQHDCTKSTDQFETTQPRRLLRTAWLPWILVAILTASYVPFMAAYIAKKPSDKQCARQLSVWSPLQDAVEYESYDFDNDFDHQTIYRGPPSSKLEHAWDKLWQNGVSSFPSDKLPLANRTAQTIDGKRLQTLEDVKAVGAGYTAMFEVFHQLHCLNTIRQYTWRDWYFRYPDVVKPPVAMLDSDVGARMHVDHCIETLRLTLMCHGDTTPFFTFMDPSAPLGAQGDFNAHHKCRNFDKLSSWMQENSLRFEL